MKSNGNGSTGTESGSRRPHEIQAEIERTRQEMDGTLNALETRLTPGQLYDQAVQYLRNNGGTEFVSNLGEQAKQNPLPVALVGIGLAWLMATDRNSDRNSGTEPELSGPGIREKASQAKARLGETASAIGDRATQVRDTTRQQLDRAKSGLDTMMREQPLALGAIGLAIGALAAALAPRTQTEAHMVGRVNQAVNPQAKDETQYPDLSVDPLKKARDEERERLQAGVKPYAERAQSEPPV
jgi:uncharacterized protein DUF3618